MKCFYHKRTDAITACSPRNFINTTTIVLFLVIFMAIGVICHSFISINHELYRARIEKTQAQLQTKSVSGLMEYLRPFNSLSDLKQFLEADQTDKQTYSKDFDCDDFAFMLSKNAMDKGYQFFPFAEGNHLKNVAHVSLGNNSIAVYTVEPQTDEIHLWGRVD